MFRPALFLTAALSALTFVPASAASLQTALFAGGCFWSVEKDFDKVPGVRATVSGFAGGHVANPTYGMVVQGGTGHLETVQVTYDPAVISYQQLVHEFLRMTDVLDDGGQFCDRGDHYLTAVFAAPGAEADAAAAEFALAEQTLGADLATRILPDGPFYAAEDYHQDFYASQEFIHGSDTMTKAERYARYRRGCGRDARVAQVWGGEAFSAMHGS